MPPRHPPEIAMPSPSALSVPALALCLLSAPADADWLEQVQRALGQSRIPSAASAALTEQDMVLGLREALDQGTRRAVAELGRENGFLGNTEVRIPLPDELNKVEGLLRRLGQDKYADQFVTTLNRAAEQAVPEAATLFADAIGQMSVADARAILGGPDDAATRYFRKSSEARLKERFLPIIRTATDEAGVTAAYKRLVKKAGPAAQLLGTKATDLDAYVQDKTLDGLFKMIAAEEKRIRQEPLARGSELLRKVFGAFGRQR
jgi:hypothetical protein